MIGNCRFFKGGQWAIFAFLVASVPVACNLRSATADPRRLSAVEFAVKFQELAGERVLVEGCHIAGTTARFLRCEPANGSVSIAIDAVTMDRNDFQWALENCPTGSAHRPGCTVSFIGTAKRGVVYGDPELIDAKIQRSD
jgi:hypothetical protein